MASKPGLQLNFKISEDDRRRLDELCATNSDANIGWMALVLLRYGMRHAKAAIVDDAKRSALEFPSDEPDLI
jgi:hypothetical protein